MWASIHSHLGRPNPAARRATGATAPGLVNRDEGVVIDIRPAKDFAAGHIVGALNIPQDKLIARMAELDKFKGKTIILVDAAGQHAGGHARELLKAGYNAAKLSGGISSWRADNLPVVK